MPDHSSLREDAASKRKRVTEELLSALADFDAEALLSLVRPGRLGEVKQRLFEARVAFEGAHRG